MLTMLVLVVGPVVGYLIARFRPARSISLQRTMLSALLACVVITLATNYTSWSFQSDLLRSWSYGAAYISVMSLLFLSTRYCDSSPLSLRKLFLLGILLTSFWLLGRAWLRDKPQTIYALAPGVVASQASAGFAGNDWEEIAILLRPGYLPGFQKRLLGMMVWDDNLCNEKTLHARWVEQSQEALVECNAETVKVLARVFIPKH